MGYQKFDVSKLEKLNDPERFDTLMPEAMWDALGRPNPRTIVEIGAGTGLFAATFVSLAPAATVYAVDTEPAMIEWMSANRPEVGDGRVVSLLSDETRVPLDDGIADLVVMINLHHELAEPAATYREAWRLLAPGGQLLAVDWAPFETPRGPSLAIRVSAEEAIALLEHAGFVSLAAHDALPWHWLVTGDKSA